MAPDARIVAALIDGNDPNGGNVASILQAAARSLSVELVVLYAGDERELEDTFAKFGQLRPGGLVISVNAFLFQRHKYMADFANGHGIPAISTNPFAMAGGLMSYTASDNFWRPIGVYTGRILQGEKPADMPVQQATRFRLVINMKTAKSLGMTFPTSILVSADEVIE